MFFTGKSVNTYNYASYFFIVHMVSRYLVYVHVVRCDAICGCDTQMDCETGNNYYGHTHSYLPLNDVNGWRGQKCLSFQPHEVKVIAKSLRFTMSILSRGRLSTEQGHIDSLSLLSLVTVSVTISVTRRSAFW